MSALKFIGVCCSCLSIWAILQLTLMGVFFHIETPILIHDAEDEHEKTFTKYIEKTRENFAASAINCWIAAGAYAVTLLLSCVCVCSANASERMKERLMADDEIVCAPKESPVPKEVLADVKKRKIKTKPRPPENIEIPPETKPPADAAKPPADAAKPPADVAKPPQIAA